MAGRMLDINNSDVVKFTNQLEKMHKSDLPVSVRLALNEVAFQDKKNSIPTSFKKTFTIRRDKFIDSHTAFNRSPNTFDIDKMYSESGAYGGRRGDISGERLELQERGGTIASRTIPTYSGNESPTRISESSTSKQKATFYWNKFKDKPMGHFPTQRGRKVKRSRKYTFIKTKRALLRVERGGDWKHMYTIQSTAKIKPKTFIQPAGRVSMKMLPGIYINEAKKRISKMKVS